ncbi:MAG: protein-glutamate O-methyltransferase CheR [Pelovirga sp.]
MSVSLSPREFAVWQQYIYEICGIHLDNSKGYLIETRLQGLLKECGAVDFSDLHRKVTSDFSRALRRRVIDAVTTNETSFFRDQSPFELLRHKLLPELIDRRRTNSMGRTTPIRIWSAACSTGQEVYSIAIVIKELLGSLNGYDVRILGTDISDHAVAQASHGYFSNLELGRGIRDDSVRKYFISEGSQWKIRDEVRAMTSFRTMNLLEPFTFPVPFDLIFCRNVAIYFNEKDKIKLFRNLGRVLAKDGALLVGSTESIAGLCPEYKPQRYHRSVFYQIEP